MAQHILPLSAAQRQLILQRNAQVDAARQSLVDVVAGVVAASDITLYQMVEMTNDGLVIDVPDIAPEVP